MKVNENQSFLLIFNKSKAARHGTMPIYVYQLIKGKRTKLKLQLKTFALLRYQEAESAKSSMPISNKLIKKKAKRLALDGLLFPFFAHKSPNTSKFYLRGSFNLKSAGHESK